MKQLIIQIDLNPEERYKYDMLSTDIKETINLFDNNFELIQTCLSGTSMTVEGEKHYASGSKHLYLFAESKGWSEDLDLNVPYYKQLNEVYNPDVLYERLKGFNEKVRDRLKIINNATEKLECVDMLINKCNNYQFIIFNSSLSLADKIAIHWNNYKGAEQIAAFHNKTPTQVDEKGNKYGQTKLKRYIEQSLITNNYIGMSTGLTFTSNLIIPNLKVGIITGLDKYKIVKNTEKITYSAMNENNLLCILFYVVCSQSIETEHLKKRGLYNNVPILKFNEFKNRYNDFNIYVENN